MESRKDKAYLFLIALCMLAGLVLSIISWINVCSEACAEAHNWKFIGLPTEIIGIPFFVVALILHIAAFWRPRLIFLGALLVALGIGAEIRMIYVQNAYIGKYCPVCLTIAAFVAFAGLLYLLWWNTRSTTQRGNLMFRGTTVSVAALIGFFTVFFGLIKVDPMMAAEEEIQEQIVMGNQSSNKEIYIFTDWQCPACREVEPIIERMFPTLKQKARIIFVDHPLSPESLNYTPYNLAFMVHNKEKYMQIRSALERLADRDGDPSVAEVNQAVSPLGVKYEPLNYSEVALGIRYFKKLSKQFGIKGTPTIVVVDRMQKKGKKLSGADDITEKKILNALNGT